MTRDREDRISRVGEEGIRAKGDGRGEIDLKKGCKYPYKRSVEQASAIDPPQRIFLMVDGKGTLNTSREHALSFGGTLSCLRRWS
jgi:hypothetical protein